MTTKLFIKQLNKSLTLEGRVLIAEFFISFSRFECALKTSQFFQGDDQRVSPNWSLFIASITPAFDKNHSEELRNAFEYILIHPPRIQMVQNNQLGWRPRIFQENDPEINRVGLSIRDVRNNLFHGGKFQGNFERDVSRNYVLLNNSILVLNDWLRLSDQVRNNYMNPID